MSGLAGIIFWNGNRPSEHLERVLVGTLRPASREGVFLKASRGLLMAFGALYTNRESRSVTQPIRCPNGELLAWEGRLDNRAELQAELKAELNLVNVDATLTDAPSQALGS